MAQASELSRISFNIPFANSSVSCALLLKCIINNYKISGISIIKVDLENLFRLVEFTKL